MTDSALEAILRRDRLLVAGALGLIAALAWGYVIWLAADMDMGGMDMPEFRMIPSGLGLLAPVDAPWTIIEFALVFVMWAGAGATSSAQRADSEPGHRNALAVPLVDLKGDCTGPRGAIISPALPWARMFVMSATWSRSSRATPRGAGG